MAEVILLAIAAVVCVWVRVDLIASIDVDALPNVKKTWFRKLVIGKIVTRVISNHSYYEVQISAPIVGWRRAGISGWHHPLARVYTSAESAEQARSQLEHLIDTWLERDKEAMVNRDSVMGMRNHYRGSNKHDL